MEIQWDRIGLGSAILVATIAIVYLIFLCFRETPLRGIVSRHNHIFQLILSLLFFVGLLLSVYEGFGVSMVGSLLSGVGIALGLALQPVMKKMIAGIVFDTTIQCGKRIKCGEYIGIVTNVGMVHTWIELDNGEGKACIHNDYFNTNPITILRRTSTAGGSEQVFSEVPLKYW